LKVVDVRKQIASGETGPLYLLEGEDLQSRHDLAMEFGALVDEGLQAFNVQHLYANEATTTATRDALIAEVLASARTLPMMAPRRVIAVHEAERLLSPRKSKDEEPDAPAEAAARRKRSKTPAEELEEYFAAPEMLTTLIFVAGALDDNRRLVKLLRKHGETVRCGVLESPADAAKWIRARLETDKLSIEPQAITTLLHATGLSLGRIREEIEKLALFAAGESTVTAHHVKEMVRPEVEPSEGFALGKAIWNGDARKALREVDAQFDAGLQPVQVLGQLRAAARGTMQTSDERVRRNLDAVFRTDLAMKSSGTEPRYLIERLVFELCHEGAGSRR
jgi:DNA polymerase-3 subunit delta